MLYTWSVYINLQQATEETGGSVQRLGNCDMTLSLEGKCLQRALKHRALSVRIRGNATQEKKTIDTQTQQTTERSERLNNSQISVII